MILDKALKYKNPVTVDVFTLNLHVHLYVHVYDFNFCQIFPKHFDFLKDF